MKALRLTTTITIGGEEVFSAPASVSDVEACIAVLSGASRERSSTNGNGRSFVSVNPPSRLTEADLELSPAEKRGHEQAEERKKRNIDRAEAKRKPRKNVVPLTEDAVDGIADALWLGTPYNEIMREFRCTFGCLRLIDKGDTWSWRTGFTPLAIRKVAGGDLLGRRWYNRDSQGQPNAEAKRYIRPSKRGQNLKGGA